MNKECAACIKRGDICEDCVVQMACDAGQLFSQILSSQLNEFKAGKYNEPIIYNKPPPPIHLEKK